MFIKNVWSNTFFNFTVVLSFIEPQLTVVLLSYRFCNLPRPFRLINKIIIRRAKNRTRIFGKTSNLKLALGNY